MRLEFVGFDFVDWQAKVMLELISFENPIVISLVSRFLTFDPMRFIYFTLLETPYELQTKETVPKVSFVDPAIDVR